MIDLTEQQYLHAVFCLSRASARLSVATIARAAGLTMTRTLLASIRLGRAGFVDPDRMHLTMRGLAAAASIQNADRLERIRDRARLQRPAVQRDLRYQLAV